MNSRSGSNELTAKVIQTMKGIVCGVSMFALVLCCSNFLDAQTVGFGRTSQVQLPGNPADSNGYTAIITMHAPEDHGYVRVTVVITGTAAFTVQQQFVVRLTPTEKHLPARNAAVILIPVEAEQGKRQTVINRRIPKWTVGSTFDVELMTDGRVIPNYDGQIGAPLQQKVQRNRPYPLLNDIRWSVLRIGQPKMKGTVIGSGMYPVMSDAALNQLPEDWRDFRAIDVVLISFDEMKKLPTVRNGKSLAALRDWLMQGGMIFVTDAPSQSSLSQTLNLNLSVDADVQEDVRRYIGSQSRSAGKRLASYKLFRDRAKTLRRLLRQMIKEAGHDPDDPNIVGTFGAGDKTLGFKDLLPQQGGGNDDGVVDSPEPEDDSQKQGESVVVDLDYQKLMQRWEGAMGGRARPASARNPQTNPTYTFQPSTPAEFFAELTQFHYDAPVIVVPDAFGFVSRKSIDDVEKLISEFEASLDQQSRIAGRVSMANASGGMVFWTNDAQPVTTMELVGLNQFLGPLRSYAVRRGVEPLLGDVRANRWYIPGVAQPPVYTFMGLLGIFVILVGPVAYRQTSKSKRSHLMFAIAPILAALTTIALVGYSITADGFGTIARVRQLTWIDGKSGDATERIRATYFAGVRPSAGLVFDGNSEVVPYRLNSEDTWEDIPDQIEEVKNEITVGEDQLRLGRSYMPSRSQQQFVTHQPRHSVGSLRMVDFQPSGAAPNPTVTSTLEFPIRRVVIRDANGFYWGCDEIPAGAKNVELLPYGSVKARTSLGRLYNDFRPLSQTNRGASRQNQRRNRGSYYGRRQQTKDIIGWLTRAQTGSSNNSTEGRFEGWLYENVMIGSSLPEEHFIGISDVSEDVLAVPESEMVESIRYVFGSLQ